MTTKEKIENTAKSCKEIGLKMKENNIISNTMDTEVCNWIPIVEGQKRADGKYSLLISGVGRDNKVLPTVELDFEEIQKCTWVQRNFGFEYYINKKSMDYFMSLIRLLCINTATRTVYNHTGWIIEDNKYGYIHANGCIGLADVEVELEESINNYYLPDKIINLEEACKQSLQLCEILEDNKGMILQSIVYLSPLVSIINQVSKPPEMLVWIWGKTGSRKTSLARVYLSHHGNFANKLPCTFNDTKTAIELKANQLKDTLCLCDDFAPKQDCREKKMQDSNAELVLRMYGDRVAKGRSSNKLDIKNMNVPRGMMLVTGESIIYGESSNARLLSIEVSRESINLNILTEVQRNTNLLGEAMRGYIEWLIEQLNKNHNSEETLGETLVYNFEFYRDELRSKHGKLVHGRTIEAIAWVKVGFTCMLQYMVDRNIIDEKIQKSYEDRLDLVTTELIDTQVQLISSNSPTDEFLNTIKELIDSNSIKLATLDNENKVMEEKLEYLSGYRDKDTYYFYTDKIYSAFKQAQYRKGVNMNIGQRELVKQLREEGIVKVDSNNDSPKKVINIKDVSEKDGYKQIRPRMLHIQKTKIDNFSYIL